MPAVRVRRLQQLTRAALPHVPDTFHAVETPLVAANYNQQLHWFFHDLQSAANQQQNLLIVVDPI